MSSDVDDLLEPARRTVVEALQGHEWVAVVRRYEDGSIYVKTADGGKFRVVVMDE